MDSEIKYLLSLDAVRDRAKIVGEAAEAGKLSHFDVHEERLSDVADFVVSVIKVCLRNVLPLCEKWGKLTTVGQRDFGPDKFDTIPPHGRWQHFEVGNVPRITDMLDQWKKDGCDDMELTRRLIDLFFVSVLLDAGAGDDWRYAEPGTKNVYERSEGIAVASLYMFKDLAFSSKKESGSPIVDGEYTLSNPLYLMTNSDGDRQGSRKSDISNTWKRIPGIGKQLVSGYRASRRFAESAGKVFACPIEGLRRRGTAGKCCWFVYLLYKSA
jgi:hypothetical protein